jgi:hypothetical protein
MSSTTRFAHDVRQRLQADGYRVHHGTRADGPSLDGRFWFTWAVPGMADAEAGPTCRDHWKAWVSALEHRLSNSRIELSPMPAATASSPLQPFHPAELPSEAFDVQKMAARYSITTDAAAQQIERLRRQTIYMNDRYQVNVEVLRAPFGEATSDILWLSIKRRDRQPIHDWRDLQQIKSMIVGQQHEGFEVYPAETHKVDTANQYHLWVFCDPKVRLPLGSRTEISGAEEAATVGATQRPFAGKPG